MGCASSKKPRCRHCQNPLSRSYSVPIHHLPEHKGDSYHVVALTSTTLGSLKLDENPHHIHCDSSDEEEEEDDHHHHHHLMTTTTIEDDYIDLKSKEFSMEVIQAKTWSNMINEKIPKLIPRTPIRTPPGEPETINSWELMEGLEDDSPLRAVSTLHDHRSFSFHAVTNNSSPLDHRFKPKTEEENDFGSPRPLWVKIPDKKANVNSDSNLVIQDFDPDIISTFRKTLEELSPTSARHLRSPGSEKRISSVDSQLFSKDDDIDIDIDNKNKVVNDNAIILPTKCPPQGQDKVVLYFTSLRGIRKTYEDCSQVRDLLKGFRVRMDERDVSMHIGFREELKELLDGGFRGGLPRVFVNGSYIGGAEEVKQLHEDGELEMLLQDCLVGDGDGDGGVCEACGDVRFVPCETCSGSCKIYYEDDSDDEEEGEEGDEEEEEQEQEQEQEESGGFQRCPDCNENGIVRCPICCY